MLNKNSGDQVVRISPSILVWAVVIALILTGLFVVYELVLVVITAVVIAAAIAPMARWFVDRKFPRVVAVVIIYFGIISVLIMMFYYFLLPLMVQIVNFSNDLPQYVEIIEDWNPLAEGGLLDRYPILHDVTSSFTIQDIVKDINKAISGLATGFIGSLMAVFGGILNLVLIMVLSFYMAVQENGVRKFLSLVTPDKSRGYVLDLWKRAETKIGLWLQGQIILAVIVAVLVYLGLTLLGVPHALLLAALAGVMELIPIFGPIIAGIPAVIIAFVEGDLTLALLVLGLYLVIQQFESQLIYPLVVRKVVGLSPIIVIIALIAGYQLAGFLGILLSVPLAAVLLEFLNDIGKEHEEIDTNISEDENPST